MIPRKIIKYPSVAKGGDERIFIDFLEKAKVKYELIKHRKVFTAQDKAATLKVKPNIIGKTLVLKIDKRISVVLIPANKNLDKNKFKKNRQSPAYRQAGQKSGFCFRENNEKSIKRSESRGNSPLW